MDLVNEMSNEIGKVNIYDIYQPCFENMATVNRARQASLDRNSSVNKYSSISFAQEPSQGSASGESWTLHWTRWLY